MEATLQVGGRTLTLGGGRLPLLMGIVNVTPDSFSDGGAYLDPDAALAQAERLVADGADWIDVGGESTRPGAEPVAEDEELRRVLPVLERLRGRGWTISADTRKPAVARQALAAGATVLNDVGGFADPDMRAAAAESQAACVVMHMRGTPQTMQSLAEYHDVVADVCRVFEERLELLRRAGVPEERVALDPGIGFAKRTAHNLEIFRRLDELLRFGRPLLVGASRKRLLGDITGRPPDARLAGTIASSLAAWQRGAHLLRVHDVAATRDALATFQQLAGLADGIAMGGAGAICPQSAANA